MLKHAKIVFFSFLIIIALALPSMSWGLPAIFAIQIGVITLISFLFVLTLMVIRIESSIENKLVFFNFIVLFSIALLMFFENVTESLFIRLNYFPSILVNEYLQIAYCLSLNFAVSYIVINLVFRNRRPLFKYAMNSMVVSIAALICFSPFFSSTTYLQETSDVQDYYLLSEAYHIHVRDHGTSPTVDDLARNLCLYRREIHDRDWKYDAHETTRKVHELYPFLTRSNFLLLIWKPLFKAMMTSLSISVLMLVLYLAIQYLKDPPQGAYIDRLLFTMMLYCVLELSRCYGFLEAKNYSDALRINEIALCFTIGVLVFAVVTIGKRLRFLTSPQGQFYESNIVLNARTITRWRDVVDDVLVSCFIATQKKQRTLFSQRQD